MAAGNHIAVETLYLQLNAVLVITEVKYMRSVVSATS